MSGVFRQKLVDVKNDGYAPRSTLQVVRQFRRVDHASPIHRNDLKPYNDSANAFGTETGNSSNC